MTASLRRVLCCIGFAVGIVLEVVPARAITFDPLEGGAPKDADVSTIDVSDSFEIASGSPTRVIVDLAVTGSVGSYPLRITRRGTDTPLGFWRSQFFSTVEGTYGVRVTSPDGDQAVFWNNTLIDWNAYGNMPGGWNSTQGCTWGFNYTTVELPDGGLVYLDPSNGWRVESVRDPHGLVYTYEYAGNGALYRIVDASGRWLSFSPGRVDSSDGNWVTYTVQGSRTLIAYADGTEGYVDRYLINIGGNKRHFSYHEPHIVMGVPMARLEYDMVNYSELEPGSYGIPGSSMDLYSNYPILTSVTEPASGVVFATRAPRLGGDGRYHSDEVAEIRSDGHTRRVYNQLLYGGHSGDPTLLRPSSITDFQGHSTTFEYAISHTFPLSRVTNAHGHATQFQRTGRWDRISRKTYPDGAQENWAYQNALFVSLYTDARGFSTTFDRFPNGLLGQANYPDGSNEGWGGYNSFNQATIHRFKNGAHEWFDYDSEGRLLRKWLPSFGGPQTCVAYTYYPDGHPWEDRVWTETDPAGRVTTYEYDLLFVGGVQSTSACAGRGLVTKVIHADGTYRLFRYDIYGHKVWEENELGHRTTYTYDTYGRPVTVTDPLGRTATTTYLLPGSSLIVSALTSPSGERTEYLFDANLRKTEEIVRSSIGAEEGHLWFEYDAVGNLTKITESVDNTQTRVTTFEYDNRSRKITENAPFGRTTRWEYDTNGNVTRVVNPDGTDNRKTYDALNRVLTSTDEMGQVTSYTYWSSGQVHTITDPRGFTHEHLYDASSRLTERKYPTPSGVGYGSSERWDFNSDGTVAAHYNRSGQKLNYVYDNRGREIQRWWDNTVAPTVDTAYDAANRVISRANVNSTLTYSYDAAGQLLTETQANAGGPTLTVGTTYDSDGRRNSFSAPSVWLGYGYSVGGLLSKIQFSGGVDWVTFAYNKAGQRTQRGNANGSASVYQYDGAGRLQSVATNTVSALNHDYGYDSRDRRIWQVRDGSWGDTFEYQADSQLTRYREQIWRPDQNYWNSAVRTDLFAYDASGNRTNRDEGGAVTAYQADALNQYTMVSGATIAHSDGRGNLTQWKDWVYTYDADNRLVYAGRSGYQVWFYYDAMGRLSKLNKNGQMEHRYYDGSQAFLRTESNGTWIDLTVWGPTPDEVISRYTPSLGWQFYHQDAINSVVAVSDMNRNLVERYRYDAYGQEDILDGSGAPRTVSAIGNPWMFTGQEFMPDLGLNNYKNRFYNADLGRFVQNDPIRFDAGDLNLYRYCFNNPFNKTDPTGLAPNTGGTLPGSPSAFGNMLRQIPLFGGLLGGVGDMVSGVGNAALGIVTFGQSGTFGKGVGQIGYGITGTTGILTRDVAATVVGLGGTAYTTIRDVANVATFGQFAALGTRNAAGKRVKTGVVGALVGLITNAAIPDYGFYGGKSWGIQQFGSSGTPAPLNRVDQASFNHDINYRHSTWVSEAWSTNTSGAASGVGGIAYVLLGTLPFSIAGALQGP